MTDGPKLPDGAVVLGADDLANAEKVRRLSPTVEGLAKDCHATVRTERNAFGHEEKVATVPLAAALEAMRPAWRQDSGHQAEFQAAQPKEEMRDRQGHTRRVWAIHARQAADDPNGAHLVPVWKAGGRKLVTGPNGNLWVADKHGNPVEDTGRACLTRPWFGDDDPRPPMGAVFVH